MERRRGITLAIIIVLIISVIGLGIAFAAFSQTLTINGTGTVESSKWQVVFEGADGSNTIGAPTLTGSAQEITHPTIKNNSTEISTYEATLKTPGDSITYNFKIHNKGDYAASISSVTVSGQKNPTTAVNGWNVCGTYSVYSKNRKTCDNTFYKFYYTDNNKLVGQDPEKDCLEPGEYENVSLELKYSSTSATDTGILPTSNLVINNLGVNIVYNQGENGRCYFTPAEPVANVPFVNYDKAYYTYEGKSFIGTGVDNIIITENTTSLAAYSSEYATECSDGSIPTGAEQQYNKLCPEGTTAVYLDHPAADAAAAYCTGCRLMTLAELVRWAGFSTEQINECFSTLYAENNCHVPKAIAKYNGSTNTWVLADPGRYAGRGYTINSMGYLGQGTINSLGVRPVVSIPSTATMTGSGTQQDPYVIQ